MWCQNPLRLGDVSEPELGFASRLRPCSLHGLRPGANGVVELSPLEFLDRLADLVPPPRKHRHRYHGVFAPNHRLRKAVTALAIGNVGKRDDAATDEYASDERATGGCCDAIQASPDELPVIDTRLL